MTLKIIKWVAISVIYFIFIAFLILEQFTARVTRFDKLLSVVIIVFILIVSGRKLIKKAINNKK